MSKKIMDEVKKMLIIILILSFIEYLIFSIFGYFEMRTVFGCLLGAGVSFLNFLLLAITVEISAKKGKSGAQGAMGISYILRLAMIAVAIVFAIKSPHINYLAAAIPLLFPRIGIYILDFINKKREEK